jgi:hypothetical protein
MEDRMIDDQHEGISLIVTEAIASILGDVSELPEAARARIRDIYTAFFSAYLDIARLKGFQRFAALRDPRKLDPEIVEYMRHFFSDYQHIYREFNELNRRVVALLEMDRERFPARFRQQAEQLVAKAAAAESETFM